jgi:hypothetical protein
MSVNPDVWSGSLSVFLYLVTYALDEGLSPRVNICIALTIVLGLWVKQTFLIAVPMYGVFIDDVPEEVAGFQMRQVRRRDGPGDRAARWVALPQRDHRYVSGISGGA